jgi:hypothetical protein
MVKANNGGLSPTNQKLLAWFEARPMQRITSETLRDSSITIWSVRKKDAPRSARKLWELGFLERQNGTKDPYWFNPGIDHRAKGVERQRILCEQALAAVASRLEKITEYVAAPEVLSTRERAQLAEFVEASSAAIAKVRFTSAGGKSSNT